MEENERTPLFTNTITLDEETDRQIYDKLFSFKRLIYIVLYSAFLGFFIYKLIGEVRWAKEAEQPLYLEPRFWLCLVAIAVEAYGIVRAILAPRIFVKRVKRRNNELYGTDRIEIRSAFYDDMAVYHEMPTNADIRLAYSSIRLAAETKDLFILRTRQKLTFELSKTGFDGIDVQGFRNFMDEKCPNAKRKWKK